MKYLILSASFFVLLCLGGLYAWTAFVPALMFSYELSVAQTQVIFGVMIAVFTITMALFGKVLESSGPRWLLIFSGLLYATGFVIASFSEGRFWIMLLGISGIAGVATGLGYACPLSTCIKWFPGHKGLVSGISVAGFGGGAIVLANIAELMLERGVSVLEIFRWVGLIYGTLILAAGLIIRFPGEYHLKSGSTAHMGSVLIKDSYFWAMATAMFCGTFAGLLIVGNLMPIALASNTAPRLAALGISTFAAGNAIGRITWGRVVDKMETGAVRPSLLFLAASLAALIPAANHGIAFILISLLIGFGFGSCFVIHASLVASRYGADRVGNVYPIIFLAYGLAGITGPWIGGWLFDLTDGYSVSIGASFIVVAAGLSVSGTLFGRADRSTASLNIITTDANYGPGCGTGSPLPGAPER